MKQCRLTFLGVAHDREPRAKPGAEQAPGRADDVQDTGGFGHAEQVWVAPVGRTQALIVCQYTRARTWRPAKWT